MTDKKTDDEKKPQDASLRDVLGSLAEVASATTQFTMHQVHNAVTMVTHPSEAMNIVKDSLDSLSNAMNPSKATAPAEESTPRAAPEEPFTGRKS